MEQEEEWEEEDESPVETLHEELYGIKTSIESQENAIERIQKQINYLSEIIFSYGILLLVTVGYIAYIAYEISKKYLH